MKRYILTITAQSLLTAGCATMEMTPSAADAIVVRPSLSTVTKSALTTIPTTRTLYVSAWYNAAEGSNCNYFNFCPFSYNEDAGGWRGENLYWPQKGSVDFLAYSTGVVVPTAVTSSVNVSESVSLVLPSNAADQEDILVGAASGVLGSAPMAMVHAQSLITFRVKSQLAYDAAANRGFTLKKITMVGAYYAGTLTATRNGSAVSCAWSDLGSAQDMTVFSGSSDVTETLNEKWTSILVPSQGACPVTLTYVMHNGPAGNMDMECTFTPVTVWSPSRHYTYDITLTTENVIVTTLLNGFDDGSIPCVIDVNEYDTIQYSELI